MDQGTLVLFLLEIVLGSAQGRLLVTGFALRKRLCRLLSGPPAPHDREDPEQPPRAARIASWILTALLVPSPGLVWLLWVNTPGQNSVFALFLVAFFVAGLFQKNRELKNADWVLDTCQTARRLPVLVLFGIFGRNHTETDAFFKILNDRRIKRLWRKFDRTSIDFEEQASLAEKYGVDPKKGVQLVLFDKSAERVQVAGKDCLVGAELMQTSTFAEWLRRIDAEFGSTA